MVHPTYRIYDQDRTNEADRDSHYQSIPVVLSTRETENSSALLVHTVTALVVAEQMSKMKRNHVG